MKELHLVPVQHAHWEPCLTAPNTELSFASSCDLTDKYIQNYVAITVLVSIIEKLLVMSEQNVNRKQMCIIILDALSLNVTMPNLAVGVLNVNPRKYRENHSLLLTELLCIFIFRINLDLIYTVKTIQSYFTFDYSVSVPEHLQNNK